MHVVSVSKPIVNGKRSLGVDQWVMDDINAFQYPLYAERGTVKVSPFNDLQECTGTEESLIVRAGAFGDLLLLTPALRAYKAAGHRIAFSCVDRYVPLFEGTDIVDEFIPYPFNLESIRRFSGVKSLENAEVSTVFHLTDMFARMLGVKVEDYRPSYVVTEKEKADAISLVQKGRPVVAVQMAASTRNRNYPLEHWKSVMLGLAHRGWDVICIGSKGQYPAFPKNSDQHHLYDLSQYGLTFRQTAAVVWAADAFVGVDSAFVHVAHAVDTPAVGLYGPFPWQLRTAKAPKTTALSGTGDCAPCYWHQTAGSHFPFDKPCARSQSCSVLASIAPERIVAKVDALRDAKAEVSA